MGKFRLRTKFLFSLLLVGVGLTAGTLFVARQTAEQQVRLQIFQDLRNSVYTFRNVQKLRQQSLTRSAELLADLPILKAMMFTNHAATIQDASQEQWNLAGSDLLVLADRTGKVVALHSKAVRLRPDRGAGGADPVARRGARRALVVRWQTPV